MSKRAFITGCSGQDGSYLAELLLEKGYEVHGLIRRVSLPGTGRIDHLGDKISLHYGDLGDASSLCRLLLEIQPDEIYHLGALSHVRVSFDDPEYTADVTGTGTIRLLEALRLTGLIKHARFYNAASSEMFGGISYPPGGYTEESKFHPRSPYGCAKVFSYHATVNYRESYGLHGSNGILFNHESPRRGPTFVTRKIARAAARISLGLEDHVYLGNLDAKRDWGHAKDYVEAMWLMLQKPGPADYVIATGETHSVREFCEKAFNYVKLDWAEHVRFDENLLRPAEVHTLIGDASRARAMLPWKPSVSFDQLVYEMVDAELLRANERVG
jgi:GDPmannose 4,6-dehydratase